MAGIFSYAKTLWQDGVTAITAARLNNIEQGISDAADSIKTLRDSVSPVYALGVNDLDNPPAALILNTSADPKGFPSQLKGNGCIVIQHNFGANTYTAQLAFGFGSDKIAIRRKYASAQWTDWKYGTLA